jgi:hypothetical protein
MMSVSLRASTTTKNTTSSEQNKEKTVDDGSVMGPRGYDRSLFRRSNRVDKVLSRMSQFCTYLSSNERHPKKETRTADGRD